MMEEWWIKADRMRERLVFDGRVQGWGANMKFLSKQMLSIKMTYICRERSVGGIEATHVAQNRCFSQQHFSSPLLLFV